jgi:hypothetical protein
MDFDFTTKAGIQKFIVTLVGLLVEALTTFGVSQGMLDTVQSIAALATPILVLVIYYIVNQMAAKGKAATEVKKAEVVSDTIKTLSVVAPDVALAVATYKVSADPTPAPFIPNIKEKIKNARVMFGTWQGAKSVILQTFKDRFEAALKRYASIGMTTIEAARKAVYEITGISMSDEACERIAKEPGLYGAIAANADIKIISDLLDAIDKYPELDYLKKSFIKLAVKAVVKGIIDEAVIRIQAGEGNAASRLALQEFGYTEAEARNAQYSGGAVYGFDPWARAGVDPITLEDL